MVFIIYLLLFCLLAHPALSLRFVIENKECIQKSVEAGDKVTGSFVVIDYDSPWRDDEPILDLDITSPQGELIHSVRNRDEDRFDFLAGQTGSYTFCLKNPNLSPEAVEFSLHIGHLEDSYHIESSGDNVKDEHLEEVAKKLDSILVETENIRAVQDYFRARDARRKYTNQSTNRRMLWYALLEVVVLSGASVAQVLILRSLFTRRSRLGRM